MMFHFLQFDLTDSTNRYSPLTERFSVVRSRSATSYYAGEPEVATERAERGREDIVVFADPTLGRPSPSLSTIDDNFSGWVASLRRLPFTAKEADNIRRIFPSHSVRTFLDSAATNEALLSKEARTAKVLHIATHGYFDVANPYVVGIATAGKTNTPTSSISGFLSVTELLFGLRYSSNLVVISGCETGARQVLPRAGRTQHRTGVCRTRSRVNNRYTLESFGSCHCDLLLPFLQHVARQWGQQRCSAHGRKTRNGWFAPFSRSLLLGWICPRILASQI